MRSFLTSALVQLLVPVIALLAFGAFLYALVVLDDAARFLDNSFGEFGGLIAQLALWAVAIIVGLFAFLRLVGLLLGGKDSKDA